MQAGAHAWNGCNLVEQGKDIATVLNFKEGNEMEIFLKSEFNQVSRLALYKQLRKKKPTEHFAT